MQAGVYAIPRRCGRCGSQETNVVTDRSGTEASVRIRALSCICVLLSPHLAWARGGAAGHAALAECVLSRTQVVPMLAAARTSPFRKAACGQIVPPCACGNPNGIVRLRGCIADRRFRCAATKRHVVACTWRLPGMAASAARASRQPAGRCGVTLAVAGLPSQCADRGLSAMRLQPAFLPASRTVAPAHANASRRLLARSNTLKREWK